MRCIFDTNTLVSAVLFKKSPPGQALAIALRNYTLLVSTDTVGELAEVLSRKKFQQYVTAEEREEFLNAFLATTTLINVTSREERCRDPKDDKFLNLAISGNADVIVTGDKDLLTLGNCEKTKIVNAEAFLRTQLTML